MTGLSTGALSKKYKKWRQSPQVIPTTNYNVSPDCEKLEVVLKIVLGELCGEAERQLDWPQEF